MNVKLTSFVSTIGLLAAAGVFYCWNVSHHANGAFAVPSEKQTLRDTPANVPGAGANSPNGIMYQCRATSETATFMALKGFNVIFLGMMADMDAGDNGAWNPSGSFSLTFPGIDMTRMPDRGVVEYSRQKDGGDEIFMLSNKGMVDGLVQQGTLVLLSQNSEGQHWAYGAYSCVKR